MGVRQRFPSLCKRLFSDQLVKRRAPFFTILGLNVLENRRDAVRVAQQVKEVCAHLGLPTIFKASFDKANRTLDGAFRGPGLHEGLEILHEVRSVTGLPVLTDIHDMTQVPAVASAVDVIQIPAFLCRQTDLVQAAASTGKIIHIKKGQFASPEVALAAAEKARRSVSARNRENVLLCERGVMFGYNDLVVDMRSLIKLRSTGCPVVMDATHAAQQPPAAGRTSSGGRMSDVATLARAAAAVGVDGMFLEVHEDPSVAPVDSTLQWPLHALSDLLSELDRIARASHALGEAAA